MKGYELVLYANAVIFLGFSFFALTYGIMIARQAELCPEPGPVCDRQAFLGHRALLAAPYLGALGALLAGLAATATLWRLRWQPRSQGNV